MSQSCPAKADVVFVLICCVVKELSQVLFHITDLCIKSTRENNCCHKISRKIITKSLSHISCHNHRDIN